MCEPQKGVLDHTNCAGHKNSGDQFKKCGPQMEEGTLGDERAIKEVGTKKSVRATFEVRTIPNARASKEVGTITSEC